MRPPEEMHRCSPRRSPASVSLESVVQTAQFDVDVVVNDGTLLWLLSYNNFSLIIQAIWSSYVHVTGFQSRSESFTLLAQYGILEPSTCF